MNSELFQPKLEGQARLLILIDTFTTPSKSLEGRTKLAKLDFLLRYPHHFERALIIQAPEVYRSVAIPEVEDFETRMIRYRYGPWDPAYFALLGRLIGLGLIEPIKLANGFGYRTTDLGRETASTLSASEPWSDVAQSAKLLKRHFNRSGTWLKQFLYDNFPEITRARWGDEL